MNTTASSNPTAIPMTWFPPGPLLPLPDAVATGGAVVGARVGSDDGSMVGVVVGANVGTADGAVVVTSVGATVGLSVENGDDVGTNVGVLVGNAVGAMEGASVGAAVGAVGGGGKVGGETPFNVHAQIAPPHGVLMSSARVGEHCAKGVPSVSPYSSHAPLHPSGTPLTERFPQYLIRYNWKELNRTMVGVRLLRTPGATSANGATAMYESCCTNLN
jgi:hypothetical protein